MIMLSKYIISCIVILLLLSCNKNNNRLTDYFKNGNPKTSYIYDNDMKCDSSIHYYENKKLVIKAIKLWKNNVPYYQRNYFETGRIKSEGYLFNDTLRIGKWFFYSTEGYKSEIIEYLNINSTSYSNQGWKLNRKGDTIAGGNYYKLLHFPDTLIYKQNGRVHFQLVQGLLEGEAFICLPKDGISSRSDFSNEYEIEWDTIYNISREFKKNVKYKNTKKDIIFNLNSDQEGKNSLRGYLLELLDIKKTDTLDYVTRKIYFDIPYYVKKTN